MHRLQYVEMIHAPDLRIRFLFLVVIRGKLAKKININIVRKVSS
jgi:hypothetical protein